MVTLPANAKWPQICGASILAAICFTMSLFITGLVFNYDVFIWQAKYGMLAVSFVAGTMGLILSSRVK